MIIMHGLKKSYGELVVLQDINLHIEKGEIFGLAGRSGAGKSTLLRCINGLEDYQSGELLVEGTDVRTLVNKEMRFFRKNIGMIFQQFSLLHRLTVYENIALPLKWWRYDKEFIDKRVRELVEVVDIPDKLHVKARDLSGGQKQRVAIARALAMEPKILLCDEATSALDPKNTKSIIQLLKQINRDMGITVIIVTHQMSVIKSACDRVAILESGRVDTVGTIEEIFLGQSQALENLLGEREDALPENGINLEILLHGDYQSHAIVSRLSRSLEIDCTIVGGDLENMRDNALASLIINVADKDAGNVQRYLAEQGTVWRRVKRSQVSEEGERLYE